MQRFRSQFYPNIRIKLRTAFTWIHNRKIELSVLRFDCRGGSRRHHVLHTGTARANGANVYWYLRYILENMVYHRDDRSNDKSYLDALMPWSPDYLEDQEKHTSSLQPSSEVNIYMERPRTPRKSRGPTEADVLKTAYERFAMFKRKFYVPKENRTLKALAALDARVYVYCPDRRTKQRFIEDAENEYFRYRDGVTLREREPEDIMALNQDRTVNFVGYIGHMAFHTAAKKVGDEALLKVDYRKYAAGDKNYIHTP